MAGFGLMPPGDFYQRGQQAMAGASTAAGGMVDLHNINTRNAMEAQRLAMARQQMALDEAYRRDALAQESDIWDRRIAANSPRSPGSSDRLLGGLGGAYAGFQMGNAVNSMLSSGGSPWISAAGAVLGGIGGLGFR